MMMTGMNRLVSVDQLTTGLIPMAVADPRRLRIPEHVSMIDPYKMRADIRVQYQEILETTMVAHVTCTAAGKFC